LNTVVDLCSIGTLFAFILVCGGVLMLQSNKDLPRKFKVPYINGKIIVPVLFAILTGYLFNYQSGWFNDNVNPLVNTDAIPMFIFFVVFLAMAIASILRNLSLIPVLGMLTCLYLMAQIHIKNWIGFTVWLIIGLVIYFSYSYRHSKLNASNFTN
jgi:Ca2+/Na+ antiporter